MKISKLPYVILLLSLTGCASVQSAKYSLSVEQLKDYTPGIQEMRIAKEDSQLEHIQTDDHVTLAVRVYKGKEGSPPVILLHGLQSHSLWFTQSSQFIADLGYPVYAMDRRGSGLSEGKRGHSKDYDEMVSDINRVVNVALKSHDAKRVHILGHCFGAIPALLYAGMHPDKVQSVILPTPGVHTQTDLAMRQKLKVFMSKLTGRSPYVPVPLETSLFTNSKKYQDFVNEDYLSLAAATTSMYYAIHQARIHLQTHKSDLTMPVFMAIAGKDEISDNGENRDYYEELSNPNNQYITYTQAKHILEFSPQRDKFFADVQSWLESQ